MGILSPGVAHEDFDQGLRPYSVVSYCACLRPRPITYAMVAKLLRSLGALPLVSLALLLFSLTGMIGVVDYFVGNSASFVALYLIPTGIAAWYLGLPFSYVFAILSSVVWVAGDMLAVIQTPTSTLMWNLGSRFAVFIAVAHLVTALRSMHNDVEKLARERSKQLVSEIEARQRLEQELVYISEREQRRVGHDIHDSLCQHLTGTALAGQVLAENLKAEKSTATNSALRVVELIEDGIMLSRNLARGLNSVGRTGDGLMEALEDFAAGTNELFKISCRFECPLPVLISDIHVAEHLYRIAQEAVGNAIKHGRAKNVKIRLDLYKGGKRLRIIDDGTGRPPFEANGKSMGLNIMSYRADRIGASFSIRRGEPNGTIVTCVLPAAQETVS
jgi:signal transduction histidine kinase